MDLTKIFSAYRVAHRLPGRIRIHIPALEKLPDKWRSYLEPAAELIKMRTGINSVRIQPTTGSLIIDYDAEMMDEQEVRKWLTALVLDFLTLATPSQPGNDANVCCRFAILRSRLNQRVTRQDLD